MPLPHITHKDQLRVGKRKPKKLIKIVKRTLEEIKEDAAAAQEE